MTVKELEAIVITETRKLYSLQKIFELLEDLDDDSREWILERLTE